MPPTFMGSEPVRADAGKYAGTRVFAVEEANGLALMRALTADQLDKTILSKELPREIFTEAFRDNLLSRKDLLHCVAVHANVP